MALNRFGQAQGQTWREALCPGAVVLRAIAGPDETAIARGGYLTPTESSSSAKITPEPRATGDAIARGSRLPPAWTSVADRLHCWCRPRLMIYARTRQRRLSSIGGRQTLNHE